MEPQGDGRMRAVEAGKQPGKVDLAECLYGADRQVSAHQPADRGNRIPGVLGRGEGPLGGRKQRPPGFGQLHLPGAAHEQVAAKLALERAHRAGQTRLREMDPRRRTGEVTFLGDRHEVRELP